MQSGNCRYEGPSGKFQGSECKLTEKRCYHTKLPIASFLAMIVTVAIVILIVALAIWLPTGWAAVVTAAAIWIATLCLVMNFWGHSTERTFLSLAPSLPAYLLRLGQWKIGFSILAAMIIGAAVGVSIAYIQNRRINHSNAKH